MRWLAILFLCVFGHPALAASPIENGALERCGAHGCAPIAMADLAPIPPGLVLARTVHVAPFYVAAGRPVIVEFAAMASAELRWNGVVIARNGRVGVSAASEVPGRYHVAVPVPARLLRPGDNRLSATLSATHLRWRVAYPLHLLEAVDYRDRPDNHYLPALLVMGAIALAGCYFAGLAWIRRRREPALLAAVAMLALLQLTLEVARVFVPYTYVWHVPRLIAIAALATLGALAVADYAATRFLPSRHRSLRIGTALLAAIMVATQDGYDGKTEGIMFVGALALLVGGLAGWRAGIVGARRTVLVALTFAVLARGGGGQFVDNLYYLALAALCTALVVAHLGEWRRAVAQGRQREAALGGALQALRHADPEAPVAIRDGARTHLVPRWRIAHIRAADDYSEVVTTDGDVLLATLTLAKLHASLPPGFRRVHKSHVVNADRVATLGRRPGGGWQLMMKDGGVVPVGRAYAEAVRDWRQA